MKVVYVAGPYRSKSLDGVWQNVMHARMRACELWYQGYAVICPHTNSIFMDNDLSGDPEVFLAGDLEILGRCDAIYMLSTWEASVGATAELEYAKAHGLEVLYETG